MNNTTLSPETLQSEVAPEVRERDNAAAWKAVQENQATLLIDRPLYDDCTPHEVSGPYRDDADDLIPALAAEEWRLVDLATRRNRFQRLFTERAEYHRHIDREPDAEWKARQMAELERLARMVDATDVTMLMDRLDCLGTNFT